MGRAFRLCKSLIVSVPVWRNWQTRQTQNLVSVRMCGFDPLRRHQTSFRIFNCCQFFPRARSAREPSFCRRPAGIEQINVAIFLSINRRRGVVV